MGERLEIFTLGGVRILRGGEPSLGLSNRKAEAILIYLASTRRPQPREVLADLLWDERTQSQALAYLRVALSVLRKTLGGSLVIGRETVALNPAEPVWLDTIQLEDCLKVVHQQGKVTVETVQQVVGALGLYQGDFLEGFSVSDCRRFEEWGGRERERLHHLAVDGLYELVAYQIEQGEYQLGMEQAARLLELDPLMEAGHRQMMRLLAGSGQRTAALAQYESCQALLGEELGIEPEQETRVLYEQIRAGELEMRGGPEPQLEFTHLPRRVGECPYRGLAAFQEADARFYFGRELFVDELERVVRSKKLVTVIVGSSGSGKSSALLAGLLPRLREAGGYRFAIFRPGLQPFYALAGALLPLLEEDLSETEHLAETRKLAECLVKGEVSVGQVAERALEKDANIRQVLLVVDQFEELYTLCPDGKTQTAFIDELLALVAAGQGRRQPPCSVLITLRADFMGQTLAHRPFADALQDACLLMGPMNRGELRSAIEQPAGMQGAAFEAGLVERILDDVGEKAGVLPLLEFTLTQLWERQADGWLAHADYEAMGGVQGALAAYADQVYAGLDAEEQEMVRRALVQLVQPGEGTEDTRRVAVREELGERSWGIIQHLADKRLVVTGRDAQGHETAEVVHEALIQKWGHFQEWMDTDRAFRAWQERLRVGMRQWQDSERDEGALLRGTPLGVAENWLAERASELSEAEVEYIQESQVLAERQQRERQRQRQRIVLGLAAGLVVALALAAFALFQRQEAIVQRQNSLLQASIGLASQAQLELQGTNPERSVLLALAALEDYPYTWQAEQALGQIVREFRLRHILTGSTYTVQDAAWSPDGARIASGGEDGALRIWDADTYTQLLTIQAHRATFDLPYGIWVLAWSPQGDRIATGAVEGNAKVWDAASGEQVAEFTGHSDEVWGVSWSPDGAWVASASKDGTVRVWDASSGEEKFTLSGHKAGVNSVAWSPDGAWIATASDDASTRLWEAGTGKELFRFSGHTHAVWSVAWSPDGKHLVTAGEDGTLRIWDASTGRELSDIRLPSPVWQVAWSPDGRQLATTRADGLAQVWEVASGVEAFSLQGRTPEYFSIAWSPDGKWLATTAGAEFSVRIWDASPIFLTLSEDSGAIAWASWSPDGNRLATVNYIDRTVTIWDSQSGEALLVIDTGAADDVQDVFWSPDGSRLVTTSWDMLSKVWDATTGQELVTFRGHVGEPQSKLMGRDALFGGGWSPDGSRIVTVGAGGPVRVWDARTGEEDYSFLPTIDIGDAPRWSPDGSKIATCTSPQVLQIWDAATGDPIIGGYINNTADLSFGDYLDLCLVAEWSPDGKRILTCLSTKGGATIWNAETGEKLLVFTEHTAGLTFSTWSPNGKRIATADYTGVIKIWDPDTGAVLLSYSIPIAEFLMEVAWSPDGTRLVSVSFLKSVEIHRVWQSTQELVEFARECCATRELTEAERTQFGLR
jgi:WD40 repeat protein/DNA-binding SARP family transcriptional activator